LTVPPGFSPNPELIALYLDVLVARAQQAVRSGGQAISGSHKLPEAAQLYSALRQIEDQVLQKLPSYFNRVRAARDALEPLLGSESRQQIDQLADRLENLDRPSFSTLSERAEKERDPGIRDRLYVEALLAGGEQSIEELEKLASKIDETRTREQALAWFYFDRAQRLAKAGEFDLAIKLARKVPDLDRRAFLFFEIASAIERKLNDRVRMRETLDELISTASKASKSSEKARALLGAVHLYAKFDALRAFEVMNDAIKVINSIEQKDLTDTSVTQIIEGRKFTRVGVFVVEGFSLENVFRELGRADYFGALSLTKNLEDKPQRIATVIALAASCLEKPAKTRSLN
jgi:tetratricopeptide (TPR) repeat protein